MCNQKQKTYFLLVIFVFVVAYGVFFLQAGLDFQGAFMKRTAPNTYRGKIDTHTLQITTKGNLKTEGQAEAIFIFDKTAPQIFHAEAKPVANTELPDGSTVFSENVFAIKLYQDNTLCFDGNYRYSKDSLFSLYLPNGEPDPQLDVLLLSTYSSPQTQAPPLQIQNSDAARILFGDATRIRGDVFFLSLALLLAAFLFIDIRYPLFFFHVSYRLAVIHPEPTDYYIAWQFAGRILAGILLCIFLIAAI